MYIQKNKYMCNFYYLIEWLVDLNICGEQKSLEFWEVSQLCILKVHLAESCGHSKRSGAAW